MFAESGQFVLNRYMYRRQPSLGQAEMSLCVFRAKSLLANLRLDDTKHIHMSLLYAECKRRFGF